MTFTYTKGWFRAQKRPLALWTPKQARTEHDAGRPYTVLVGDNAEQPQAFLEVTPNLGFVGVNFLDEHLRPYLEYKFKKQGERYFLQQTRLRVYKETSETVIRMETYNFTPEGQVTIYENDVEAGQTTTKEAVNPIDVSRNWEDDLTFGDYAGFVRVER